MMAQPTSLRGFSKLPPELRRTIWLLSTSHTRIIEIKWSAEENRYYTNEEQPAVMLVCRESWAVIHEYYDFVDIEPKGLVPDKALGRRIEISARFRLFINYERDTLYLRTRNSPEELDDRMIGFANALARHDSFRGKCTTIAIDSKSPVRICRSLFRIHSLRTILNVCNDEDQLLDESSLPLGKVIGFNTLSDAAAFDFQEQHQNILGELDSAEDIRTCIEASMKQSFIDVLRGTRELYSVRAKNLGKYGIPDFIVGEMTRG
jgi:hypothetical protein